jgi:hypothetical protein
MKRPGSLALALMSAGVGMMLTGCFSYTKESRTATPTVAVPSESSSTTTTTTESAPTTVERERITTVTTP